jgi:hypothetical protein
MDGLRDVPTLSAHLAFILRAPWDDVGWNAAVGEAAVVDAVVVVVGEVVLELATRAAEARAQVAGEGRPPALVENRLVKRLEFRGRVALAVSAETAVRGD